MSIALLITDRNLDSLQTGLKKQLPKVPIIAWPNVSNMTDAEFVVVWKQPTDIWLQLPNAKVLCSLGAGVDGLINDPSTPSHVEVIRIVDDGLSKQMADYVLSMILIKNLQLDQYIKQQQSKCWQPQERLSRKKVALLGVGQIGKCVAEKLILNGFDVAGWVRSTQPIVDFKVYKGSSGLAAVLADADYVVSTLPATSETQHIIDQAILNLMPNHACFMNVGRGQTVNENDLNDALNQGQIGGAVLDVFSQEPLPEGHDFWTHDNVVITPHIAAITDQKQVVDQIVNNYSAFIEGRPLQNKVDIKQGY
jgi:glyoxylate/hydroxypyruvate reductase